MNSPTHQNGIPNGFAHHGHVFSSHHRIAGAVRAHLDGGGVEPRRLGQGPSGEDAAEAGGTPGRRLQPLGRGLPPEVWRRLRKKTWLIDLVSKKGDL